MQSSLNVVLIDSLFVGKDKYFVLFSGIPQGPTDKTPLGHQRLLNQTANLFAFY